VELMFASPPTPLEYIRAGRVRALAVTTAARSDALPDTPTLGDFVPGYEASQVIGMGAPRNTPAAIIGKLNREINAAFADAYIKTRFFEMGSMSLVGSPSDYGKLIAEEIEKWAKVVKFANL